MFRPKFADGYLTPSKNTILLRLDAALYVILEAKRKDINFGQGQYSTFQILNPCHHNRT